jgi:hypothetical protein
MEIFDRDIFKLLLEQMNLEDMRHYSCFNHHVEGLTYICLHRSEKLTVKLYYMQEPVNPNTGFLVNPHSHRYSFATRVLRGSLKHIRFKESPGSEWSKFSYDPDTKTRKESSKCKLIPFEEYVYVNNTYFVNENEIHTLEMFSHKGPVLLGLIQFADVRKTSDLYLPANNSINMNVCKPVIPTLLEMAELRGKCLGLMGI